MPKLWQIVFAIRIIWVVKRFVSYRRLFVKIIGEIKSEYAGMSNEKQCEKHCHRKPKVFYVKIICIELYDPLGNYENMI